MAHLSTLESLTYSAQAVRTWPFGNCQRDERARRISLMQQKRLRPRPAASVGCAAGRGTGTCSVGLSPDWIAGRTRHLARCRLLSLPRARTLGGGQPSPEGPPPIRRAWHTALSPTQGTALRLLSQLQPKGTSDPPP